MDSVTICNLALNMLGIPAIMNFDEQNNNSKLCKRFFPVLRDRVLRDHSWSFASNFVKLPMLAGKPDDPRYQYHYLLPGDCIRITRVFPDLPYRKISGKIYSNSSSVTLEYTARITDPEQFDPTFVEALQYLIAAEIGLSNTRDGNLIAFFRQEYEKRLAVARSIDSQENIYSYQQPESNSTFIAARRGGGHGHARHNHIEFVKGNAGIQED